MNSRELVTQLTETTATALKNSRQSIELESATADSLDQRVQELVQLLASGQEYQFAGQELVSQIFTMHPNIAHLIPRDLLWLLGGPCLHYLNDDELDKYNQLDELRYHADQQGQTFNWSEQKSAVFGTH
jgi:hypothetical protein